MKDLGDNATAQVFWGSSEGLTKEEQWENKKEIAVSTGENSFVLNSLDPNTTCFYRIKITNDQGIAWSYDTQSFKTLSEK